HNELREHEGIRGLREQLGKGNAPPSLQPKVFPLGELPSGAIQFGEEQIVATKIDASSPMNRPAPSKPMIAPFGPKSPLKPSGSGGSMPQPRDYLYSKAQSGPASNKTAIPTIVWLPEALAADGTAKISFDLPERPATYRLRVEGHAFSGGLGVVETTLHCRPAAETGK